MLKPILAAAVLLLAPLSASAAELARHKIAEWGDPLTPPQSRTECVSYASGNWPWGGGWKTCNGWKTQWRHMEVEYFLVVSGPDDLSGEVKNAAVQCAVTAAAAAVGAGVTTGGSAALGAAKVAFMACISAKGAELAGKFAITLDTPSHWTDWS